VAFSSSQFPTIVLSHVPFFRSGTTSCGPMRERGSAIPLSAGYQYQNVLTPMISQDIVKHLIPEEVTMIYSGDDHDYCEIQHNEFTGRVREITVKSASWAMGIRRPGVQLVSLWNPVDLPTAVAGDAVSTPRDTVQNHLCLLPDQLGIFLRYGQLLGVTLVVLVVQATMRHPHAGHVSDRHSRHDKSEPLLPIARDHHRDSNTSQTSSLHNNPDQTLSTRKVGGYGHVPASSRTPSPSKADDADDDADADWATAKNVTSRASSSKRANRPAGRLASFVASVGHVAWPVLLFYLWMVWRG
jgi:hypothetical protein